MIGQIAQIVGKTPLSLIDITVREASIKKAKVVGVLASPVTLQSGLFSNALDSLDINSISQTRLETDNLERLIRSTISGDTPGQKELRKHIKSLQNRGAECVILGCSELSVIGDRLSGPNIIDPLKLAVGEVFKASESIG